MSKGTSVTEHNLQLYKTNYGYPNLETNYGSRVKDLLFFHNFNEYMRSSCPSACHEHMVSGGTTALILNLSTTDR
jgi:hypothetical protein